MRPTTLRVLCAVTLMAAASPAAAQPAVLVKSKPIQGTLPNPLADLPTRDSKWIRDEAARQAANPTDLGALELAMLTFMSDDLDRLAHRQKLSFDEVSVMILHQVITRAASELDRDVRARRKALSKSGDLEASDTEMRALMTRKASLLSLINELTPRMTANARLVAGRD